MAEFSSFLLIPREAINNGWLRTFRNTSRVSPSHPPKGCEERQVSSKIVASAANNNTRQLNKQEGGASVVKCNRGCNASTIFL